MSLSLMICYTFFVLGFFFNFEKKVSLLLVLEGMMLCLIWSSLFTQFFQTSSIFFSMLLTIFMVLDSVLGMSLMILGSRVNSYSGGCTFLNF